MGNGGTVFSEKAAWLTGSAVDSREQLVGALPPAAVQIFDHVKSDPDAIDTSRRDQLQPGLLQRGHAHAQDTPAQIPKVVVQDQEKRNLPGGRQSSKSSISGINFVGKTQGDLVRGQSSCPSVDAEMTNVDQTNLSSGPSNHLESYTQGDDDDDEEENEEDDNRTRHYVRRGLRNGGDGVTQNQSEENIPVEYTIAAIPKTDPYECERFPSLEKKARPASSGTTRNRHFTRSAILCHSSEDEDHPSREPEGSLLHSLYLQLLAAGREGISLRGLFASFESQTSLPRLASNWREQVKAHLKTGPYFEEVKGRYLLCEFLVQPSSKRAAKRKGSSESLGVQTRRKAYQKTFEAVLCESAMEFQKLQQQKVNGGSSSGAPSSTMPSESTESDLEIPEPTPAKTISPPIRFTKSRKSKGDDEGFQTARNIRFGGAIPGSLKAMQARIIAETGVQDGVRCARKDGSNDSSKWQCPMMAMEGHTLCEHHSFLNERKRARYAKARKHGDSTPGKKSPRSRQEKPVAAGFARNQSQKRDMQSPSAPGSELDKSDSDDLARLDEVASQALLTMKSDILAVDSLIQEKPSFVPDYNSGDNSVSEVNRSKPVNEEATRSKNHPAPHFFARSPAGRFIAAKKTAVKIPAHSLETETSLGQLNVPSTRPPSIPPLPAFYGPRRKTVKNRSLLSIS